MITTTDLRGHFIVCGLGEVIILRFHSFETAC